MLQPMQDMCGGLSLLGATAYHNGRMASCSCLQLSVRHGSYNLRALIRVFRSTITLISVRDVVTRFHLFGTDYE